jgi:hypothetical protein
MIFDSGEARLPGLVDFIEEARPASATPPIPRKIGRYQRIKRPFRVLLIAPDPLRLIKWVPYIPENKARLARLARLMGRYQRVRLQPRLLVVLRAAEAGEADA